jgi:hypothetical protein
MNVLDQIYREGMAILDFLQGRNVGHLPTARTRVYTTTTPVAARAAC